VIPKNRPSFWLFRFLLSPIIYFPIPGFLIDWCLDEVGIVSFANHLNFCVSPTFADPEAVLTLYEWYSSYKVGGLWESDLLLSGAIDTCGLMVT